MNTKTPSYRCACGCHPEVETHPTQTCCCGKPVKTPPQECKPHERPKCPPPKFKPQPNVVEVPQTLPPVFPSSEVPPWSKDKPRPGDPTEIPWFQAKVNEIRRKGPSFGPRKDEFLPYLLVRASSGDRGARTFNGVFWESPDIYVTPNQDSASAPLTPATVGGVAQANAPNTLYAHVWNLGKAPAYRVRVEFYWFNPSLGISRADANLIGAAWIDVANRFTLSPQWTEVTKPYGEWISQGCHAIVRCPVTWVPTFENNGHECLVVRAFEPLLDGLSPNEFSAANNRHVAQRNIAVVQASSPASIDLRLNLGYPEAPDMAEVDVIAEPPTSMEWLELYAGTRNPGMQAPAAKVLAGFLPPSAADARVPNIGKLSSESRALLLRPSEKFRRDCCPLQVAFHASAQNLEPKEAQVLRIRQRVAGQTVGGYSVVLLRSK